MDESPTYTYTEVPVQPGQNTSDALTVGVSPRAVRRWLLWIVLALTVVSVGIQFVKHPLDTPNAEGLVPLLDATAEGNLPTFYSSLTLLACALLSGLIALSGRGVAPSARRLWLALPLLFALAAIDEAAGLHELSIDPLRSALDTGGYLIFPWILPASILALGVAIAYARLVRELPPRVRRRALGGALLLGCSTFLLEAVEGKILEENDRFVSLAGDLVASAQELGEMLGVVLLIDALLTFMLLHGVAVGFRVGAGGRRRRADQGVQEETSPY